MATKLTYDTKLNVCGCRRDPKRPWLLQLLDERGEVIMQIRDEAGSNLFDADGNHFDTTEIEL